MPRRCSKCGSISKTFTATLASYAQVRSNLSLSAPISTYLPALRGTKFGNVTALALGTHTPGGLPLQVPGTVRNDDDLMTLHSPLGADLSLQTYRLQQRLGPHARFGPQRVGANFKSRCMGTSPTSGTRMRPHLIHVPAAEMTHYAERIQPGRRFGSNDPGVLWLREGTSLGARPAYRTVLLEENMGEVALDAIARTLHLRLYVHGYLKRRNEEKR